MPAIAKGGEGGNGVKHFREEGLLNDTTVSMGPNCEKRWRGREVLDKGMKND